MRKYLCLIPLLVMISSQSAPAQISPEIEIGSILALNYKNSESADSPLVVNDGDGSFNNDWVLLFGAEISESLSLYAEIQTVRGISFVNYGLSAIYRPAGWRYLNFEIGKFLVPFGAFLGRRWASENPLIGFPLIYEYITALSAFDLPANTSELLRARGRGGSVEYHPQPAPDQNLPQIHSGHIPQPGAGLRILSREVYLTGAQVFGVSGRFRYYAGVANGALSNPADLNNSNGLQLHGRLGWSPFVGLDLGSSASWGAYLDKGAVHSQLQAAGRTPEDFRQTALGFDLSYSIGHLQLFSETIFNRWESPFIDENLDARAFFVEGKYTFFTRFFLAGRFTWIDFSRIDDPQDVDSDGAFSESWEYDIHQWEVGVGFRVNRNALFKVTGQFNRTHEVVVGDPADDLVAVQTVVFF